MNIYTPEYIKDYKGIFNFFKIIASKVYLTLKYYFNAFQNIFDVVVLQTCLKIFFNFFLSNYFEFNDMYVSWLIF